MTALKQSAGQPSGMPRFGQSVGGDSQQLQDTEAMMMAQPIPGQSLTQDPNSRLPFEGPPKFAELQDFIDETFLRFTDEEALPDLLDTMRSGIPLEVITEKYLKRSFTQGEITPDLILLAIEPTIYMLISIATLAEVDPVLYPEDPMIDEKESKAHTDLYRKASRELLKEEEKKPEKITMADVEAPSTVPKSLLSRTKEAVERVKAKGEM